MQEDFTCLPLTNDTRSVLVDTSALSVVAMHKWMVNRKPCGYERVTATKRLEGRQITLHHLILPPISGYLVDHINRDTLDNRSCNLRYATHAQSQQNRGPQNGKRFRGVFRSSNKRRFIAEIMCNGIRTRSKWFDTEEDAALAYNLFAERLHGEFAYKNALTPATDKEAQG